MAVDYRPKHLKQMKEYLASDLSCPFCSLLGTSKRHLDVHCYENHNHCYRHKETFKDKNETFEHLEKSHKETGRRCHHCFDFFSFDIDAMKNHIHENHSEEFKMTRGNVKNVKKRTANQKNGKLKCDRCKVSTITSAVTLEKHYYRYVLKS